MKISYTGSAGAFQPKERSKLEAKLAKVVKLIERKGEKEVHVFLSQERHLHNAEITLNVFDHSLAGKASNADLVTAMSEAIEKLEKQVLKMRGRWRDTHRNHVNKELVAAAPDSPAPARKKKTAAAQASKRSAAPKIAENPKVFRVNHQDGRKPMTLEEAMHEMGAGHDYLVFRDSKTDRFSTLLRRADGHLDLIES